MSRWLLSILFILLVCRQAMGQGMEGTVTDKTDKTTVQSVAIINKRSGVVSFTDSNGYFRVDGNIGDSLVFRHTAYEPRLEVIKYTGGTGYRSVQLLPLYHNLKGATITNLTKYELDSVERHEMFEHVLNKPLTPAPALNMSNGIGCTGCVGWLADKITGNSKNARRFKKQFATDDESRFIETRYTFGLVSALTGIRDSDSVASFINYYPMDYPFARQASELEIKAWIRYNYKQYINKGKG